MLIKFTMHNHRGCMGDLICADNACRCTVAGQRHHSRRRRCFGESCNVIPAHIVGVTGNLDLMYLGLVVLVLLTVVELVLIHGC